MKSGPSYSSKQFYEVLRELLNEAGWSMPELQRRAKLLQQQISDIKRAKYLPGPKVLRKLYEAFLKAYEQHSIEYRDLNRLLLSGIGLSLPEAKRQDFNAYIQALPHDFRQHEYKRKDNLQSRTIITDILGEAFDKKLLQMTLSQMQNAKTVYYYFLPGVKDLPGENPEREKFLSHLHRAANDVGFLREMADLTGEKKIDYLKLVDERAYFIRAPDIMFFTRIRIDNIRLADQEIFYSVGEKDMPALQTVQHATTARIVHVVDTIIAKATKARAEGRGKGRFLTMELEFHID